MGKGGFGSISLASTLNFDDQDVHLPPLIILKSSIFGRSHSLQVEMEFLQLFQDSPYIIRYFRVTMIEEDQVLYNLLLDYAADKSLEDCLQNNYFENEIPECKF